MCFLCPCVSQTEPRSLHPGVKCNRLLVCISVCVCCNVAFTSSAGFPGGSQWSWILTGLSVHVSSEHAACQHSSASFPWICLVVFHIYISTHDLTCPAYPLLVLSISIPLRLPPLPSWKCQPELLSAQHPPIVRPRWRGMLSQEKAAVATCALYRNKSWVSQMKSTNTHLSFSFF